jgi:hypothetical protein
MRYFNIKITGGTSSGPYNIYYDAVGTNTFATGYTSGTNAANITYNELTSGSGFAIQVPDSATSILLVNITGKGDCEPVVYSLGSPPVALPNLCFEFRQDYSGPITQYNFTLTDQIYNDRPVWSSETYNIKWDSVEQLWFVENWQIGIMVNTNPAIPPISGWLVLGSLSTVTVKAGECAVTPFKIKNVVITNPTCLNDGCSGGIEIQTENAIPPILYSIDNGVTTSSSPLFTNLCPSTYTAWSKDGNNQISTQTITIPVGNNNITEYNLRFDTTITTTQQGNNGLGQTSITKRFDFIVRVKDINNNNITQLPAGTIINFVILQSNVFDETPSLNTGIINRTISIQKNGTNLPLTESVVNTTINNTNPNCTTNPIYRATTQNSANVQIQGNDVVSGYVITNIVKTLPPGQVTNTCASVISDDKYQFDSATIEGCTCCSVNLLRTEQPSMVLTL